MPWWVAGYFGLYLTFSIWSLVDDHRSKEPTKPSMAVEMLSDVLLLLPALSFWVPTIFNPPAAALLVSFAAGVLLLVALAVSALRRHVESAHDLSRAEKWGIGLFGSFIGVVVSSPLLYWAFRAAVLGEHVDA